MKQKIYIAALLAGMLALAGCGGGSSSTATDTTVTDPPTSQATLNTAVKNLTDELAKNSPDSDTVDDLRKKVDDLLKGNLADGVTTATANQAIGRANQVIADANKAEDVDMTATAKALKAVFVNNTSSAITKASIPAFGDPDGDGPITANSVAIDLKKGTGTVAALGDWSGADYAGMAGTGGAKHTGMARIYTNADATTQVLFDSEAGRAEHGLVYAPSEQTGDFTIPDNSSQWKHVDGFSGGTTTHNEANKNQEVDGTYQGARGKYKCAAACTVTSLDEGYDLGTDWTFTPNAGAMLDKEDDTYLYFGWWVRKNDKDAPTHAGATYGVSTGNLMSFTGVDAPALITKATYTGKAAGKFAISDAFRPADDDSGHFTADAKLEADFKADDSTLSGTINNFRLNDGTTDAGWSVELQKAVWDTDKFETDATEATNKGHTVWSIGSAKGAAAGSWEAQLYNEKAGAANNTPQAVVGKFHSMINQSHEMVGAFGAELQSSP